MRSRGELDERCGSHPPENYRGAEAGRVRGAGGTGGRHRHGPVADDRLRRHQQRILDTAEPVHGLVRLARAGGHDRAGHDDAPGHEHEHACGGGSPGVGMILHLAFSMLVGIVFIAVLFALRRAGLGVLRTAPGYAAASVAGAALLYVVMIYLVLPWANPLMCHMTPRGPFFIGHLIYGLIFGLVAYSLARRAAPSGT